MTDLERLSAALADRYRIEREIGQGGMATVYLATDLKHDRPVALKVLSLHLDPVVGAERFAREVRLTARLQHPHILAVLDSGSVPLTHDPRPTTSSRHAELLFYVMPYVPGGSLRARLEREPQLPVRDAIRIAREMALAIQHAHAEGVIHRDIKPENILFTADGTTLVADFGIARALDTSARPLTRTGVSVGTPAYMSPEQAAGDETVDARSDVYALGVVLYEMLAGEPPFTGATAQAIMLKRLSLDPPSVRVVRPQLPRTLDAGIQHALAPAPADRLPSAAAFLEMLDAAQAELTDPSAGIASRATSWPRRAVTTAVALALVLVLAFAFQRFRSRTGAPVAAPTRLAVLPFENLGDTSEAYFADGLTDAVRGKLTLLPALQVIARASSVQYAGSRLTPAQIAGELGVHYLLTGTVRWARGSDGTTHVLVRPELVQLGADGTGSSRWQQPFDAPLTDVFRLQADIANRVTEALSVALPATALAPGADVPTRVPAAYDAYLRARAAWNGGTNFSPAAVRRARVLYQQAVALDSAFAAAWGGIAMTSIVLYANSVPTPALASEARAAVDRMQALDPDGVETWSVRSRYLSLVELDATRALAELDSALARSPNDAVLLGAVSATERSLGRWEDALRHAEAAYALDPRNASRASAVAQVYLWTRRPAEARAPADRALALAPANPGYVQRRAMVALAEGDLPAARQVLAASIETSPPELVAYMANIWDLGWVLDDAGQRLALSLGPESFDDDHGALAMARTQLYAWRGDVARARTWADSAQHYIGLQLRDAPDDAQRYLVRALALARLGRSGEATASAERGLRLSRARPDAAFQPFYEHMAARTALLVGDRNRALDLIEGIMRNPWFITPAWLRLDPDFAPLRNEPRFQALAR